MNGSGGGSSGIRRVFKILESSLRVRCSYGRPETGLQRSWAKTPYKLQAAKWPGRWRPPARPPRASQPTRARHSLCARQPRAHLSVTQPRERPAGRGAAKARSHTTHWSAGGETPRRREAGSAPGRGDGGGGGGTVCGGGERRRGPRPRRRLGRRGCDRRWAAAAFELSTPGLETPRSRGQGSGEPPAGCTFGVGRDRGLRRPCLVGEERTPKRRFGAWIPCCRGNPLLLLHELLLCSRLTSCTARPSPAAA